MGAGASTRHAHKQPDGLYQHTGPERGRCPLSGPVTPCASAAAPQRRGHHAGPCAAALSGGAAVCCCVTPHTRPTSLPASDCCVAALKARHPSQCPPFVPRVRCGPTLPPVASPHLQCGPLKSPPAGGHHRAPKSVKRNSGPLRGAVMRRRAGQCWGLCSARCASHRPQQGRRCPFGRHARPPPGQAVQHARHSVPPSPPLLSKVGQGWPLALPGSTAAGQALPHRKEVKAATLPRRNAACGRDGHTGEHPARVNAPPAAALA